MLDLVHHLRTKHGGRKGWTRHLNKNPHSECDGENGCRDDHIAQETPQQARIAVRKKLPKASGRDSISGINIVMRATNKAVEILLKGTRGMVGASGAEISRGLAVEQAEIAKLGEAERLNAAGFDLTEQRVKPIPVILA